MMLKTRVLAIFIIALYICGIIITAIWYHTSKDFEPIVVLITLLIPLMLKLSKKNKEQTNLTPLNRNQTVISYTSSDGRVNNKTIEELIAPLIQEDKEKIDEVQRMLIEKEKALRSKSTVILSQDKEIDSLKKELEKKQKELTHNKERFSQVLIENSGIDLSSYRNLYIEALDCLYKGKKEDALDVLSRESIFKQEKKIDKIKVDTWLLRAELLKSNGETGNLYQECIEEAALSLSKWENTISKANHYHSMYLYDKAYLYYEISLKLSKSEIERGISFKEIGRLQFDKEEFELSKNSLTKALTIIKKNSIKSSKKALYHQSEALICLANINLELMEYEESKRLFSESLQISRLLYSHNSKDYCEILSNCLNDFGNLMYETEEYLIAERYLNEALCLRRYLSSEVSIASLFKVAQTLCLIGKIKVTIEKSHEIKLVCNEVLSICGKNINHPNHKLLKSKALINLGHAYDMEGEKDKAKKYYFEAFSLLKDLYPSNSLRHVYVKALCSIGSINIKQEQYEKAICYIDEAISITRKLSKTHIKKYIRSHIASMHLLVYVYIKKNEYDKVITVCKEILKANEMNAEQSSHSSFYLATEVLHLSLIGQLLASAENIEGGISYLRKAYKACNKLAKVNLYKYYEHAPLLLTNLGDVYYDIEKFDLASYFTKKSISVREETYNNKTATSTPDLGYEYLRLGKIFFKKDQTIVCGEKAFHRSINIFKNLLLLDSNEKENLFNLANSLHIFGKYSGIIKKYQQSKEKLLESLDIIRQLNGEEIDITLLTAYVNEDLATSCKYLKEYHKAIKHFQYAIDSYAILNKIQPKKEYNESISEIYVSIAEIVENKIFDEQSSKIYYKKASQHNLINHVPGIIRNKLLQYKSKISNSEEKGIFEGLVGGVFTYKLLNNWYLPVFIVPVLIYFIVHNLCRRKLRYASSVITTTLPVAAYVIYKYILNKNVDQLSFFGNIFVLSFPILMLFIVLYFKKQRK